MLSKEQNEQIEQWLYQVEAEQGVEIAVVTISSMNNYPRTPNDIEQFATGLFNQWRIGDATTNNGILILVSTQDRKACIELGASYGRMRDSDAQAIMQSMVAEFRKGKYENGIVAGVEGVLLEFAGVRVGWNWPLIFLLMSIVICVLITISLFRNGKKGWGWIFVGILGVLILLAFRIMQAGARNYGDSDGWSSGGFGGGSSGGGGATGSW